MTRIWTWGIVAAALAALGCQGQPAAGPTRTAEGPAAADPPAVTSEPTLGQTTDPPLHPTVDRFAPPVANKGGPRLLPFRPAPRTLTGDLGVVRPGGKSEYKFAFTNDTKTDWTVKYVTPDCNCAVGQFSSKTIKPGETSHLTVGIRMDQREGPVVGQLTVDFWEREAPTFYLFLRSEVRKPLTVVPNTLDLGRVGPRERVTQSVEVRNYSDRDIPAPKIEVPPFLQAQLTPVEKPAEDNRARQSWKLEVQLDLAKFPAPAEPGPLVVRGDDPLEAVSVPVVLKRKAPLEAAPGELVFDKFTAGQAHERTFLLETYPDLKTLTAKDLVLSHNLGDEFSAEVVKQLGPNRFQVVTRYHPKAAYASVAGELTVSVRERDLPPARVKIKGTGG